MLYYNKNTRAVLEDLQVTEHGLSDTDAAERLRLHGPNAIKVSGEPLWRKLIEPFANIFMFVLFMAAVISVFHGDTLDAAIIGFIMAANATIYYVQRFSTERVMRSLQKHTAQSVETLRDGKVVSVDSTQLVPGDIILLTEGEKVPADARILECKSVRTDESLLTGESLPITKQSEALRGEKEVYERSNMLFQGSFVISGEVRAVVVHTGNTTEFGQIAALTSDTNTESPVQKKIDRLISQIIAVVGAMALAAFALALYRGMEFTETLKFVMALSVSAVPESLPIAISVVLVLGMRRMAARKALVRNMRAIETIGALTTIATDKTGTLTKNKLTVQETWQPDHMPHSMATLAHMTVVNGSHKTHDPLDTALEEFLTKEQAVHDSGEVIVSLPFDPAVTMSGNVWQRESHITLAVKGAPEYVLAHSDLTSGEHEKAIAMLHHLTGLGYRVLAFAHTPLKKPVERFEQLPAKTRFTFGGFIAVADVLRPEAKRAIKAALDAGVTVRMITGDHQETAYHIARQLGMVTSRDQIFDSRRMSVMTDDELAKAIKHIRVFSRVIPENKYRILTLLKRHNITAMTGDGVNDVPALANAHVGVAMGSGSHIAKDAGDIILLDDNFKSIIDAMKEGRTIIANVRRMLYYLLATNSGEALVMMGSLIIGMPLPLVPVQILWINLVTDTSMVIPLGLEPGEKDVMQQKPHAIRAPILSKYMVVRMVLVATSMAAVTLCLYAYFNATEGHAYANTIAFSALVVMQWSNAFNARSDYESMFSRLRVWNGKFYAGLAIAIGLQMVAIFGPLQGLLHIETVLIGDLISTAALAFVIPVIIVETHKYFGRQSLQR